VQRFRPVAGHLLTSSNYDDSQKKVTGGRNGYGAPPPHWRPLACASPSPRPAQPSGHPTGLWWAGAKLANIFSSEFVVETADSASGKRFKQTFHDNMLTRGDPQIKPSKEDWTRISFVPDFAKFHMKACPP